jgi:plastocyanin
MQGHVRVLDTDDAVTTQAANDEDANEQFQHSRAQALDAEADANVVRFSGEQPGERTYQASVGVGAANGKVNVLEMLPRTLNLDKGDRVRFHWKSPNEAHTVAFPTGSPAFPAPFGFDCGSTFQSPGPGAPCIEPGGRAPEFIADPGNAPSGTLLTMPTVLVDSGVLAGAGYHLSPSLRVWSVATNRSTATGAFQYQCTIHDFMHGTLNVTN